MSPVERMPPGERSSEKEEEKSPSTLRAMRKAVMVTSMLATLGGAGEAFAGVRDRAAEAFEKMDNEVQRVDTERTVRLDAFRKRLAEKVKKEVSDPRIEKVMQTIKEDLNTTGAPVDTVLKIYENIFFKQAIKSEFKKPLAVSELKKPAGSSHEKSGDIFQEMDQGIDAFGLFLNGNDFSKGVEALKREIPVGEQVKYNGLKIEHKKDGKLYFGNNEIDQALWVKIKELYKKITGQIKADTKGAVDFK